MRETSDSSREKKPSCGPRLRITRRNTIRCQDRPRRCVANLLILEYALYVQWYHLFFFFFSGKINSNVKSRFLQLFVTIFWLLVSSLRMILFNDQFIQILIPIFFLIVKWFVKTQLFSTFSIFILLFMIEREDILIALKHLCIGAERINSSVLLVRDTGRAYKLWKI